MFELIKKTEEDYWLVVMEYIDGCTFSKYIENYLGIIDNISPAFTQKELLEKTNINDKDALYQYQHLVRKMS